ncbi:MAG: histidinol-phosphate transaminase [Deltaproteobacteria bacterium]|nr:MAG: histidinol-phosphate transaminase [Deltaproteobacteria bacterium]
MPMNKVENLYRTGVTAMHSYTPIEPPDQIALRLGMPEAEIIKLDANENPYGAAAEVLDALGRAKYLSIYPDPAQKSVRQKIAEYAGCTPQNIVAGAGADELIDLLCRLVLNPGDKVLTFTPTFSYYRHVVELNSGIMVEKSREADYSIATSALEKISLDQVKMVLLCSPNNPTGNLLEPQILDFFLQKNILVVVDEAYYEFSQKTFARLVQKYEHLVILRTFSKCFGLAGLRVGYGIMSPVVQEAVMKIKPPYSVNMAAETALAVCIGQREKFWEQVRQINAARDKTIQALKAWQELEVYPSEANFILCRIKTMSAKRLCDLMEKRGILLRYFDTPQLKNHLRISVGTELQMDIFLHNFREILMN